MKLSFLVDNKTENAKCRAEWGLSLLIESGGHRILFDTGSSGMFAENAKIMGINLKEVDAVCISHGHYDHTEGMMTFTQINSDAPIYIHKNAFHKSYGTSEKGIDDWECGIWWSDEYKEKIKNRLVLTENVVKINDNMTLIGNIPNMEDYPPTEDFYREVEAVNPRGDKTAVLEKDDMSHEQFLAVCEDERLFIISGCCHRGVMPTIKTAQKYFPDKEIAAVIAGMHMYSLSEDRRRKIVSEIIDSGVKKIFPVHCTGMDAIMEFKARMGEDCVIAASGDVYEL